MPTVIAGVTSQLLIHSFQAVTTDRSTPVRIHPQWSFRSVVLISGLARDIGIQVPTVTFAAG